ncbi:flagellar biosynthesis regulator FlaF [Caulobacter sp. 602-2]|uniref:Flagellar biosynthesis regulator FlaF n=1 Tax=Caulobacter sp. 602-2 TaxID=2710887 RepID=A0A6G4QUJ7_9CAUL|nr:flagellar biosynthesis regulator FlaF [Caulobacter sp. 602-2]NGM48628.1 flagellar biosynthesis regulator FlaF [Caulobacter sp. 602-2]
MSLRAYQQAATRTENPREVEYRLFGQVTRALMEASQADVNDIQTRIHALDWNRRVWSALATDCALPENTMTKELRASIISLSIWVGRHSSLVMRKEEDFEPLIEINRMIMQGLAARAEAA